MKGEKRDAWINFRKDVGFLKDKDGRVCNKHFPLNSSFPLTLKPCKLYFTHTVEFMSHLLLTLHRHYMELGSINTLVLLKETERALCDTEPEYILLV